MSTSVKSSQAVLGHDVDSYTWHGDSHITFILVHGIGVSHRYFIPLAKELSKRHTVVAVDLPGYGSTEDPAGILSLDELAQVVQEFVRLKKLENVILIGQSMGTQIVVRTYRDFSNQYTGCILLAPTIDKNQRTIPIQLLKLITDSCREPLQLNKIIVSDYVKMGTLRYLKTLRYMMNDSIENIFSSLKSPLLVIGGGRDVIAPCRWVKQLSDTNKSAQLELVADAPHNFQFTHPKETALLCERFITLLES